MAAPTGPRQTQGMLARPTLRAHISTPRPVQERYVGGRVSPMYWLTDIMPFISPPARRSLIASTVELVHKFDSYQMLETDEEPDSSRLKNIFFAGLGVKHFREEDSSDSERDYDWILVQANRIVDQICTFIQEDLWEVARPVKAILDPRRQLSRAEAWILRCSIHPEVIDGDEVFKAVWRMFLDEYLESSANNWELDTGEDEPEFSFDYDDLIATLSPGPEQEEMLSLSYNYDEVINGLSSEPAEWEELELASEVELEPYGPQYKVEDLTELNLSPPKDEECAICLERFDGQAEVSACRQLNVCNHSFHEDCIDAWVNGSHAEVVTCPNCRAQICYARPRREKE